MANGQHGGAREGEQGRLYPERSDLSGGGTATHMPGSVRPYGGSPTPSAPPVAQGPGGGSSAAAPGPTPQDGAEPTPLDAPGDGGDMLAGMESMRGPEPLLAPDPDEVLREVLRQFPHEDIRILLEAREG